MNGLRRKFGRKAIVLVLTALMTFSAAVPVMAAASGSVDYDHKDRTWKYYEDEVFQPEYSGFAQNKNGWWYIRNGVVSFDTTSVIKGTVEDRTGWWYVKKGKVQTSATTFAQNKRGWWYIKDGTVSFGTTSVIKGTVNGVKDWWYVKNGKVQLGATAIAKNKSGWWYIKDGKVSHNTTGLIALGGKTYYVKNGKNSRSRKGLVKYKGKYYYIRNGVVDTGFSGNAKANGTTYYVKNGVASVPKIEYKIDEKAQKFSSPTDYLILVNRSNHTVAVYKGRRWNWNRVKFWKCTNGKASTPTISGTYHIQDKGLYFDTGTRGRCWYYTRIHHGYLFHSVIYDRSPSPVSIIDGTMGAAASHGCIRLALANARWIYNNIPRNTTVYIY